MTSRKTNFCAIFNRALTRLVNNDYDNSEQESKTIFEETTHLKKLGARMVVR